MARRIRRRPRMGRRRRGKRMQKFNPFRGSKGLISKTITLAPGQISPDRLRTSMRYVASYSIDSGAATDYFGINYSMNDIESCDPQAATVRVLGYNQISALYNRFRVVAFKYHVRIIPTFFAAAQQESLLCAVGPINGTVSIASNEDVNTFASNPRVKVNKTTNHASTATNTTASGPAPLDFNGFIPLNMIYGVAQRVLLSDDRYAGDTTPTAPAETASLVVAVSNENGARFIAHLLLDFTFYVEWYDRKRLTIST